MSSPARPAGPVSIEIPGRTALLLVELAKQLGAETPAQVVAQALGLLQTIQQAKSRGHRIILRDPSTAQEVDLAL